ncbi:MAG: AEC family transporter [Chloroflexota bacterium]
MTPSALLTTFVNNLLPILLIGGAGFLLGKALAIEARALGRVVFYLFGPLLVFNLLIKSQLDLGEALETMGFATFVMFSLGLLAFLLGKVFELTRPQLLVMVLAASFGNNGNYGLPLVSFAFGEEALAHATIYFVMMAIFVNTVGVLVSSLGHMDVKTALLGLFKLPMIYGVLLAAILNLLNFELPVALARTIDLAADATIPLMLVMLGLELTRIQWSHNWRALGLGVFIRLIAGPVIALLLTILLGVPGPARQSNVVQSGMPTAVTVMVLAGEYRLEPELVTAIIFLSTILSPFTLTPLLVYLGGT